MSTVSAKEIDIKRKWHLIDATDKTLGRLATKIAGVLRGKHKVEFTPHVDCGDYIVVINAKNIKVTGKKLENKKYYSHSGYPGGIKEINLENLLKKSPEMVIEKAVKGMLPKNTLGRKVFTKLKVYANENHKHEAQQPQVLEVN